MAASGNKREIFYKKGDVLIISGDKEMLVSSQSLSMVSPVFEIMFEPGFLEGDKNRSKDNPLRLPLDDDDPSALALLFHILHFSLGRQQHNKPGSHLLLRLVQLADKYSCLDSIQNQIEPWLYLLIKTSIHEKIPFFGRSLEYIRTREELVAISFLINAEEAFRKSTATFLNHFSARDIRGAGLSKSLEAALIASKEKLALKLNRITEDSVRLVFFAAMAPQREVSYEIRHQKNDCWYCQFGIMSISAYDHATGTCNAGRRPGMLMECLESIKLWPITSAIETSITDHQNAVNSLLLPSGRSLFHNCSGEKSCILLQQFAEIKSTSQAMIDRFESIGLTDMGGEARSEFLLLN